MGIKKFGRGEQLDDLFHPKNLQSHYMCSLVFSAREITGIQNQTEISTKIMGGNMRSTTLLT